MTHLSDRVSRHAFDRCLVLCQHGAVSIVPQGSSPLQRRTADTALAPPATAAEALLREYYPLAYRVAIGLCGTRDAARVLLPRLMHTGVRMLPRWRDNADAYRWFIHHTVLATRDLPQTGGSMHDDPLVPPGGVAGPGYAVFIATLRGLSFQQREAFLLHFGEDQDARGVAVAMDCSTEAAGNHLIAATTALAGAVSGRPEFDACLHNLRIAWLDLTPVMADTVTDTRRMVRLATWQRRFHIVRRAILTLAVAAIIATMVWFAMRRLR
jgi:hypothetical protein